MKISALQQGYINSQNKKCNNGISFGIANSQELKKLFTYGLPCMYSGIEMIDPQKVQRLIQTEAFKKSSKEVIKALYPFKNKIADTEKQVFEIISNESKTKPELNLREILQSIAPEYLQTLREEQKPVFKKIRTLAKSLPEDVKPGFYRLMNITDNKLNDVPIIVPFSSKEFIYKLEKIKNDFTKQKNYKGLRTINKMLRETERLTPQTNPKTINLQKKIISYMGIILERSHLNNNQQLYSLIEFSKDRLNEKKIKVPFSRKAFIYDLASLLRNSSDKELNEKILNTARELPSSGNSVAAYITKFAAESPEKIAYRLLWPTFASVEHILPKSRGGADAMSNFGGATARENADRSNIDFTEQLKRRPKTPIYCQKYVERLTKFVKAGIFARNNINTNYIDNFTKSVTTQSKGAVKPDISEFQEYRQKGYGIFTILKSLEKKGTNPLKS